MTLEKTKMPLGAKLTQNDFECNFWNGFWHRIEMKTYSNYLKGLNQIFKRLKEILTQEMTKMPFFMNFANNIEIKCRERCNWSETYQMIYNARKEELNKYF